MLTLSPAAPDGLAQQRLDPETCRPTSDLPATLQQNLLHLLEQAEHGRRQARFTSALDQLVNWLVSQGRVDTSKLANGRMRVVRRLQGLQDGLTRTDVHEVPQDQADFQQNSTGKWWKADPSDVQIDWRAFRSVAELYTTASHEWVHVEDSRTILHFFEPIQELDAQLFEYENSERLGRSRAEMLANEDLLTMAYNQAHSDITSDIDDRYQLESRYGEVRRGLLLLRGDAWALRRCRGEVKLVAQPPRRGPSPTGPRTAVDPCLRGTWVLDGIHAANPTAHLKRDDASFGVLVGDDAALLEWKSNLSISGGQGVRLTIGADGKGTVEMPGTTYTEVAQDFQRLLDETGHGPEQVTDFETHTVKARLSGGRDNGLLLHTAPIKPPYVELTHGPGSNPRPFPGSVTHVYNRDVERDRVRDLTYSDNDRDTVSTNGWDWVLPHGATYVCARGSLELRSEKDVGFDQRAIILWSLSRNRGKDAARGGRTDFVIPVALAMAGVVALSGGAVWWLRIWRRRSTRRFARSD